MACSAIDPVIIRDFERGDEEGFRLLNEEWITRYFVLEEKDRQALADPWGNVLNRGGRIVLAVQGGRMIGCCALLTMPAGEFEVAKMAVTASAQGSGIGRRLLARVIADARALGARRLYLETNHQLRPAIHLYESLGFRHIPPERVVPSPYARADVYMEMVIG